MPAGTPVEQTAARAARPRRRSSRRSPKSPTTRPMPAPPRRSISTAWCGSTTCARGGDVGDMQVNLVDKHQRTSRATRSRTRLRPRCRRSAQRYGANVKVVEVPPGPPVLAPIVAEVYGPDAAGPPRSGEGACARCSTRRPAWSTSTTAASAPRRADAAGRPAQGRRCSACRSRRSSRPCAPGSRARPRLRARRRANIRLRSICSCRPSARATSTRCCSWRCAAPAASSCRSASSSP